ncbi:unnamed protein product [Adineta ricciae]|uniref:Uncharacterized protein n=1 Tax=Adineta ricciae TaxID=249248 RepID=A0A815W5J8_ADIRI|nr:unnamed protein product [Adineta ricciae]
MIYLWHVLLIGDDFVLRTIFDSLLFSHIAFDGVARTAYRGVVQCRFGRARVYVTPNKIPWKGYGNLTAA